MTADALRKGMNPYLIPVAMDKIVKGIGLSSFGRTIRRGGNARIQIRVKINRKPFQ